MFRSRADTDAVAAAPDAVAVPVIFGAAVRRYDARVIISLVWREARTVTLSRYKVRSGR